LQSSHGESALAAGGRVAYLVMFQASSFGRRGLRAAGFFRADFFVRVT